MSLNINYEVLGEGTDTIVFLHGWEGSTKSFSYVQKYFSPNFKTVNIDFLGFGKSDKLKYPYDVYDYAISVYLLIKKLKLENITIISHSFGGRIAIILASMFEIKVNKIVLVDSAGLKPRYNLIKKLKILHYKILKKCVELNLLNKKTLKNFGSQDYKRLSPIMKRSFVKIVNQDLFFLLKYIQKPTYLVWGKKDKSTPLYMAKKMKKGIECSKMLIYKDSGHFSYLENLNNFCFMLNQFIY